MTVTSVSHRNLLRSVWTTFDDLIGVYGKTFPLQVIKSNRSYCIEKYSGALDTCFRFQIERWGLKTLGYRGFLNFCWSMNLKQQNQGCCQGLKWRCYVDTSSVLEGLKLDDSTSFCKRMPAFQNIGLGKCVIRFTRETISWKDVWDKRLFWFRSLLLGPI